MPSIASQAFRTRREQYVRVPCTLVRQTEAALCVLMNDDDAQATTTHWFPKSVARWDGTEGCLYTKRWAVESRDIDETEYEPATEEEYNGTED